MHHGHQGAQDPLHHAAEHNNVEAARALIAAGADPGARNDRGLTPVDFARREYSLAEIRGLLLVFEGG